MFHKKHIAVSYLAILLTFFSVRLFAADFVTDTLLDEVDANPGDGVCATANNTCSLRAAVQESNHLDGEHSITLTSGTYWLNIPGRDEEEAATGDLDVIGDLVTHARKLTINGAGAAETVINGADLDRVFDLKEWSDLTLNGLSIANGLVQVLDVDGNWQNGGLGGGILNRGRVVLNDVWMYANQAMGMGGAIFSVFGYTELNHTLIYANLSSSGSGLATLNNNTIIDNSFVVYNPTTADSGTAAFLGGGIYNWGNLEISHSVFHHNMVLADGGGIYHGMGRLRINNTTFNDNFAQRNGGGIYMRMGELGTLNLGEPVLSNVTFTDNIAQGYDSSSQGDIPGITPFIPAEESFVFPGGFSFSLNFQDYVDGFLDGGIGGGGLFIAGQPGQNQPKVRIPVVNTIFANNKGGTFRSSGLDDCGHTTEGEIVSLGHNIDSKGNANLDGRGTCNFTQASDTSGIVLEDLKLVPFEMNDIKPAGLNFYNGTPPALTQVEFDRLLPHVQSFELGSAAVDVANNTFCPETDQQGRLRPTGACDIGAFELLPPVANPMQYVTQASGVVEGVFNVTDAGPNALTFEIVDQPTQGTVGLDSTVMNGAWVYTANAIAAGTDQFSFRACYSDGQCSNAAIIGISIINDAPVTEDVAISIVEGSGTTSEINIINETQLITEVADVDYTFPLGAFFFSVKDIAITTGDSLVLSLQLPLDTNIPSNAVVRKLDNTGVWRTMNSTDDPDISSAVIDIAAKTIALTLRDNDVFDSNPALNVIRDPVALAVPNDITPVISPVASNNGQAESSDDKSGGALSYWLMLLLGMTVVLRRSK